MWSDVLAASSFAEARILIVEDDRKVGSLLWRLFSSVGYQFCTYIHDAMELSQSLRGEIPDVVLLSWKMSVAGDGSLLEDLRDLVPEDAQPSVLILNAGLSNQARLDALSAGAAGFISKPFDAAEVLLRVRNLLAMRRDKMKLEQQVYLRTLQLEETIGELRQVQRQLHQQERLRTLGSLAAGIAHDFNNALTVVLGFAELYLGRNLSEEDPVKVSSAFRMIATAASDAAGTVRRLREFYRPYPDAENDRQWLEINAVVRESIQLALPKWMTETQARGVTVELHEDYGTPPKIHASPSELREVLMNLIFNAVDAMQSGGVLTMRTGIREGMAMFEVGDTGRGMDQETRDKCLEPFFTTKGQSGSGLGLSTTYEIIRRHHGRIDVVTALNQGAVFRVCLPVSAPTDPQEAVMSSKVERELKVLVVDNQQWICEVVRDFLLVDNHIAVMAENGYEALARFREESFDLVITDLVMPFMSGDQLAFALKEIDPSIPILLFTSMFDSPNPDSPVDRILQKPAGLSELRTAIREAVAKVKKPAPADGELPPHYTRFDLAFVAEDR